MKKLLSLVLILGLLISMTGVAIAYDDDDNIIVDSQKSSVFSSWQSSLWTRSGSFVCGATSSTFGNYNQSITLQLQKYNGGWSTIKTWSKSGYSRTLNMIQYYPLTKGTFRIKSTHRAGGEIKTDYSSNYYY